MLATSAGTVIGGHVASAVKSYTGCLVKGVVTQVAEGDLPAKACASGQPVVHFSGGDITAITAGSGLTGGATNGDAALSLATSYQLPQNCTDAQVAKWDAVNARWECAADSDSTYSAGTGLDVADDVFSIEPGYRVRNNIQCANTADFVYRIDANGVILCRPAPTTSVATVSATQSGEISLPSGANSPNGTSILTAPLPAGTWAVYAKGAITAEGDPQSNGFLDCQLNGANGSDWDRLVIDHPDDGEDHGHTVALMAVATTSGETISVSCYAATQTDGVGAADFRILAIKVG